MVQQAKQVVLDFYQALEGAGPSEVDAVIRKYTADRYDWYGVHPFNKLERREDVINRFWLPLYHCWAHLQRRQDIFIAGENEVGEGVWTLSMGHWLGILHRRWLGIPPTHNMTFLRYAEFNCVQGNKISRSAMFCDLIFVMNQAGFQPLPDQTGSSFLYPGPQTHDGLQFEEQDAAESDLTRTVLNLMLYDFLEQNKVSQRCPPEVLERSWQQKMIWYGPAGIGATYTIPRYQREHQFPFRDHIVNKNFNGHVCRFCEGKYAGFFGWPNLSHTPTGGFLGLPGSQRSVDMRVVDVYRRAGNKLAENWVLIDLPHWLLQQGVDVFKRCEEITSPFKGDL